MCSFCQGRFCERRIFRYVCAEIKSSWFKGFIRGKAHASDSGYAEGIKKMVDLVNEGFFQAGCTSTDYETAQNLFTSGQAAIVY